MTHIKLTFHLLLILLSFVTLEISFGQGTNCDKYPYTIINPVLPAIGGNIINNGNFESNNLNYWITDPSEVINTGATYAHSSSYGSNLVPTSTTHATLIQTIPTLASGKSYTLKAWMRSATGTGPIVTFNFNYRNSAGKQTINTNITPTTTWQEYQINIVVPAGVCWTESSVYFQVYKQQAGSIYLDDIVLTAQGGEWAALSTSAPVVPSGVFTESFNGTAGATLDPNKWLVAKKWWGAGNGVVPENLELQCGTLRTHGHGDLYTGSVKGIDGINGKRVGACIATKDYFASGRYDVRAKIALGGVCSAFWTFHYIEDANYEGGAVKNTEIDWEFPSNLISGSKTQINDANCNTWGGYCEGISVNDNTAGSSYQMSLGVADASDCYHMYTFEWHTGGGGVQPSISWYFDGALIKTETNPDYIGFRAARFWLGVWYPNTNWVGPGNHSDIYMDIDSVSITPYYEVNDVYENETDPYVGYASICSYPVYPSGCGAPVQPAGCSSLPVQLLSFSGNCFNEKTELNWSTANETNSKSFTIEGSEDGINFHSLGVQKSIGNSSNTNDYKFNDYKKLGSYYRLLQKDLDGKFTYSKIIQVDCNPETTDDIKIITIANELAIEIINNTHDNQFLIELFDINGKLISSKNEELKSGENKFTCYLANSSSLYILRITKGERIITQKISIQ